MTNSSVHFADPLRHILFLFNKVSQRVSMSPATTFAGDVRSFDDILELQRAGYEQSASIFFRGSDSRDSDVDAIRVSVTKKSRGHRSASAQVNFYSASEYYESYGVPAFRYTKLTWFMPPYVIVREDSGLRSVDEIMAAIKAREGLCIYHDSTVIAMYSRLVHVVGAWRLTGASWTVNDAACRTKE